MVGDVIYPLMLRFVAQVFLRLLQKLVPLSDSVLPGVPCYRKTCFSRPKLVFRAVARVTGYVYNHPAVSSITVSTLCLP